MVFGIHDVPVFTGLSYNSGQGLAAVSMAGCWLRMAYIHTYTNDIL